MQAKPVEHKGRRIELREHKGKPQLVIDGKQLYVGRLPGGRYFLKNYAFDWTDDVMDLAKRYINYRDRVEGVKRARAAGKEGGKGQ